MKTLIKGEKRAIGIEVTKRDNEDFTITDFDCVVYNRQHEEIKELTETDQDGKSLYGYVDTSQELYTIDTIYYILFTVTIEEYNKVLKEAVYFKPTEDRR